MSEFQYVGFRAIDAPVSEENLEFMEKQSSAHEITPWAFDNEYHYGDFRGNAPEMLRRGYDFHLHYANYGTRKLMIRLPQGLPRPDVSRKYLEKEDLSFLKDKQGSGGILCIQPYVEAGELDDVWDAAPLLDRLLPLRARSSPAICVRSTSLIWPSLATVTTIPTRRMRRQFRRGSTSSPKRSVSWPNSTALMKPFSERPPRTVHHCHHRRIPKPSTWPGCGSRRQRPKTRGSLS